MNGKQTKKIRKLVNRAYPKLYKNLVLAMLDLPFKNRLKIALQIVLKKEIK